VKKRSERKIRGPGEEASGHEGDAWNKLLKSLSGTKIIQVGGREKGDYTKLQETVEKFNTREDGRTRAEFGVAMNAPSTSSGRRYKRADTSMKGKSPRSRR